MVVERNRRMLGRLAAIMSALLMLVLTPTSVTANPVKIEQARVVSSNPANFTPNVLQGEVSALARIGNTIYAGGEFSQVQLPVPGSPIIARTNLFAFDENTGAIVAGFAPVLDGAVESLLPAPDGKSIYVGGRFRNVNGVAQRSLARLDVSSGSRTPGFTAPVFNAAVLDLRFSRDQLLVAGAFSYVGGSPRVGLVSLNAASGALTDYMRLDLATTRLGVPTASKFDTTPDGSALFVIGNFTEIDGQPRSQFAKIDLGPTSASVSSWQTDFYAAECASVFYTYMRDLDVSPDGTYLVVTTTGAYRAPPSPCDTWARFEVDGSEPGVTPTWVNYTGGDTTYAVEVTGTAVYLGGHFRWANNPYAGDRIGPGAVPREGLAAVDPRSGMPYSWNPTRYRGVGVFDIMATETGLWIGHDTDVVAYETRMRLAYFPLAGGITPPPEQLGSVPNDVYLLGLSAKGAPDPSVLYRVNTGGPAQLSVDDGPDWEAGNGSDYVNTGNNATYSPLTFLDASVPNTDSDRAPRALFDSERWDGGGSPEMRYSFPVPENTPLEVRLYFANRYSGTSQVGQRVFDVSIENELKLDDFDIVSTYGDQVGGMQQFTVTSLDGTLDIEFGHVIENPLVNAIEIVDPSLVGTPPDPSAKDVVRRQFFAGTGSPSNPAQYAGPEEWGSVRGSMLIDGVVYAGWSDGRFTRRTFDGQSFGPASDVYLYDGSFGAQVSGVTGMFFDKSDGRMYFTVRGDSNLYWRGFSPESDVVGPTAFVASGDVAAMDAQDVAGLFRSGDRLYFADENSGALWSVGFQDGTVVGPKQLVDETIDWRSRGSWVWNGSPATGDNNYPTAVAEVSCSGLVCDFDSTGSYDEGGSVVSASWDFGDGQTSDLANPSHAYPRPGEYTAVLTVTDDEGATSTSLVTVSVVEAPNVAPVASFTVLCVELVCDFESTSTDSDGSVVDWAWVFGDGQTGSGASVQHTFAAAGDYQVQLTVTDDDAASDAAGQLVTVAEANVAPVASFTVLCVELVCDFESTSTDSDGSVVDWAWVFGDGQTGSGASVQHTFAAAGDYQVQLTVTDDDAASDAAGQLVTVAEANVAPVASFTVLCVELVCDFESTSTDSDGSVVDWAWVFGDGQTGSGASVQHTFAAAGDYQVQLTVTDDDAASDAAGQLVTVAEANVAPVASFTVLCVELVCDFESTSTDSDGSVVDWAWVFGDGQTGSGASVQHTFAAAGDYQVQLTVTDDDAASDAAGQLVTVAEANVAPVASFTVLCVELVCDFESTSTDSDGSVVDWAWVFGDGQTGSGASVQHTFAAAGDYQVQLTVTDDDAASDVAGQLVTVAEANVAPVASFTVLCVELVCDFESTSTDSDGSVVDWAWVFGDGQTGSGASVQHTFAAAGDYQVQLTVTDDDAASDVAGQLVTVAEANVAPVASFTVLCVELVCDFESTSTDSDGSVVDWAWVFGDGQTGSGASVQHTFAAAGDYQVQLTVTDDDAASDVAGQLVTVAEANVAPVASFTVLCVELVCDFESTSTDSDGSVVDWAWVFGDGQTGSGASVQHTFAAAGDYQVQLTVTDDDAASDVAGQLVTVAEANVAPVASFTVLCVELVCDFESTSTDSDGSVVDWAWVFGDGQTGSGASVQHTFAAAGDYQVQLTVTDDDAASDVAGQLVTVAEANVAPVASFTVLCVELVCDFESTSTDSDGSVVDWAWVFGDGQTGSGASVQHTFAAAGDYQVQLTVTDDDAASDVAGQLVTVAEANVAPVASFTVLCVELVCDFESTSTDSDGSVVDWAWVFGDGQTGSGASVQHTFAAAGDYQVQLTVTDDDAASDVAGQLVTVDRTTLAGKVVSTVGSNEFGQLGRPASTPDLDFGEVDLPSVVESESGRDYSMALDGDGRVWAWGRNDLYQLGNGTTTSTSTPTQVPITGVVDIEPGHYHGLAVRSDGTLWSWGYGWLGQLGLGANANESTPRQVTALSDVVLAGAGRVASYAVTREGRVWAWGDNSNGELGNGTFASSNVPVQVTGLPPDIQHIAGGRNHVLALDNRGRVWAWGDNGYGQVGDGTTEDHPTPVLLGITGATGIAAGAHHSVAVLDSGEVMVWGRGYRGQLGLGSTASQTTPVQVPGLSSMLGVGAGRDTTYAFDATGEAWGWGDNAAGQVGDGTTVRRTSPVRLPLSDVVGVAGGSSHAVVETGSLVPPPNADPVARFSFTCDGLSCSFDGSGSSDSDGTVEAYEWDFAGEGSSSVVDPEHTFAADGQYSVTLTVTDDVGAQDSAQELVEVSSAPPPNADPVARFSFTCDGLSCSFDGSGSSDSDGTVEAYEWDFAGEGSSSVVDPEHTFAADGQYSVTLTVTDDAGAQDSAQELVEVSSRLRLSRISPIEIRLSSAAMS